MSYHYIIKLLCFLYFCLLYHTLNKLHGLRHIMNTSARGVVMIMLFALYTLEAASLACGRMKVAVHFSLTWPTAQRITL
jgi:hypothetical protein